MNEESAVRALEEMAKKHASEAIRMDSQGSYASAIYYYQLAISTLIKLVHLYPDYKLNRLYLERASAYQERVNILQRIRGISTSVELAEGQKVETLKASFDELLMTEKPQIRWGDVAGLDTVKRAIKEAIVYPSKRPDLFPLGWHRGILLFGPPGCGKTMLAAATAFEIDGYFISVDAASIMSKWLGEAEKNVAKLFKYARSLLKENCPVLIFIDEVDSLFGIRSHEVGGEVRVRNQFLKEMDGLTEKGKNTLLYVIGATNKPWTLDMAFLRRLPKRIYVPHPDLKSRIEMFKLYTAPLNLDPDVSLGELGKLTEGYSGSDIRDICQAVQLRVVSELFESGEALKQDSKPRSIKQDDFREVLKNRRPSISPEAIRAYATWSENFGAL